jgi:hypothetical protein
MAKKQYTKKDKKKVSASTDTKKATKKATPAGTSKKKATRKRDKETYPGLNPRLFSKIKQEFHDIDYMKDLTPAQKKKLSKFMEEWLGARIKKDSKPLHNTKQDQKRCYDANNARNRDIYAISRATGRLLYYESGSLQSLIEEIQQDNTSQGVNSEEDRMIEYLDSLKKIVEDT